MEDVSTTTKTDSSQTFLEHLNSIENCIKFTVERESEGKIAFFDCMVHRQEDGRLTTTVYRKATHTGRFLSFSSHHPSMHKRTLKMYNFMKIKAITTKLGDFSKNVLEIFWRLHHVITSFDVSMATSFWEPCFPIFTFFGFNQYYFCCLWCYLLFLASVYQQLIILDIT